MRILPRVVGFLIALTFIAQIEAQSTLSPQDRASIDRWAQLTKAGKQQQVIDECNAALISNTNAAAKIEIQFSRALAGISGHHAEVVSYVEAFTSAAPHDERGGELLFRLAKSQKDLASGVRFHAQAVKLYPGTYWATMSQGAIRQAEGMGKPFVLDFTDAVTGKSVSLQNDFKGKVIVIDFWRRGAPIAPPSCRT